MSNRRFFTLMAIGTILLLLILVPKDQLVGAENPGIETAQDNVNQSLLSELDNNMLAAKSLDGQKSLENKIQALEYKHQVQSEAQQQPQKSLEEICRSIATENLSTAKQADEQKPKGIFELEQGFLGDQGYLTTNMWRGEYSGYETEVYAGALFSDQQQGILILKIPALDFLKVFSDPNPSGSLTITAVDNNQIQLASSAGNITSFSLPAQQFTTDLTKSMSVVDLPPLPTPIADPCAQFNTP